MIATNEMNILFTSSGRRVELLQLFRRALEKLGIDGQIVAADWVDYLGAAVGNPPTINGYGFSSIAGEAATLGIDVVTVDLDTTGSTVADKWLLLIRTTTNRDLLFARINLV